MQPVHPCRVVWALPPTRPPLCPSWTRSGTRQRCLLNSTTAACVSEGQSGTPSSTSQQRKMAGPQWTQIAPFLLLLCHCLLACPGPWHLARKVPSQMVRLLGFLPNCSHVSCSVERMFALLSLLVRMGPGGWRKELAPRAVV